MGTPAARITDTTAHGGKVTVGFPQVLIGNLPASRIGAAWLRKFSIHRHASGEPCWEVAMLARVASAEFETPATAKTLTPVG